MRSPFCFLVSPKKSRYENTKVVGDFNMIVNTSIEEAKDVSRIGVVVETPFNYQGDIKVGDEVIIHHNIFREFYDINGKRKDSKSFFRDNLYIVFPDSIYLYKSDEWTCNMDYIFINPISDFNNVTKRRENLDLLGEVYFPNGDLTKGQKVMFTPESEYEIIIEDIKLYRMRISDICLVY